MARSARAKRSPEATRGGGCRGEGAGAPLPPASTACRAALRLPSATEHAAPPRAHPLRPKDLGRAGAAHCHWAHLVVCVSLMTIKHRFWQDASTESEQAQVSGGCDSAVEPRQPERPERAHSGGARPRWRSRRARTRTLSPACSPHHVFSPTPASTAHLARSLAITAPPMCLLQVC